MEEATHEPPDDGKFCIAVIAAGFAVLVCALPISWLDSSVYSYFEELGADSLESLIRIITEAGSGVVLGAIALIAFAAMRDRRTGIRVAFSLLVTTIVVALLKSLISRQRPGSEDFDSFPSGHTASAFAVATPLFIHARKWGWPFLLAAGIVGFSRIFRNSHYLSDVTAGLGTGLLCGGLVCFVFKRSPRFAEFNLARVIAGFLALGFAAAPWMKDKNTLGQSVLIMLPPLAFYVLWSYLPEIMKWGRGVFARMSDRRVILAIFTGALILFIVGNWASTLFDRDEGWYAEIAREMVESGDYLVPTYLGRPFLEKPMLPYWLMAGSMHIFGVNEFAARLPSAVAGAFACVVLFLLARRMFGRKTALVSTAVFATSFMTPFIMHAALTDSVLVLFVLVSFYGFWRILKGDASRLPWAMLYAGAGLAFLSKFLAGVAIVGFAALLTAAFARRWDVLKKARIPTGALLFLGIVCAWFLPAYFATNGELGRVFYEQNFGRAASALQGHEGPFFYYIAFMPLIFFPWFSLLPGALLRKREEIRPKSESWWFLVSWAGGTVLLFSAASTKLPHYVFPAVPALSILVGSLLCSPEEHSRVLAGWKAPFAYFFLGLVGFLVAVGTPVAFEQAKFTNFWRFFTPACGVLFVVTLLAIIDLGKRNIPRAAATLCFGMVAFMLLFMLVAMPSLDYVKLPPRLGRAIAEESGPQDVVVHWGYIEPSLAFYAGRNMRAIRSWQEFDEITGSSMRILCVVPPDKVVELASHLKGKARTRKLFEGEGFNFGRGRKQRLVLFLAERTREGTGSR